MAQNPDSLFVQANELYRQENYTEALKAYEEIEAMDQESWALYYNIGNIHYKMNRVAPAIFYYEKALKLRPDQQDVRFNLEFANQMVLDNIEPLPRNLGQRFMDAVILKLTYETWAKIAVGLAFLFALLFLMYHFSYSTGKKRFYFITSIITVILVTTSVFFAFRNQLYVKNNREAIIFATEAEVMNAPTTTSEAYFELHEGTKVTVLESLDNWKKIRIADGKIGWIEEKDLKEI
jgi:tetratricopeptide (TPR) repeat protein